MAFRAAKRGKLQDFCEKAPPGPPKAVFSHFRGSFVVSFKSRMINGVSYGETWQENDLREVCREMYFQKIG